MIGFALLWEGYCHWLVSAVRTQVCLIRSTIYVFIWCFGHNVFNALLWPFNSYDINVCLVPHIVKESHNRPDVAQRVPGGLGSQISWRSAHEGGEVVSLTHRPPLPPGMFLVLIFTRGWVDPRAMVRSEGNMSLKNPVTPPGNDPGTVRLVAQGLNHYATPGPSSTYYCTVILYGTTQINGWHIHEEGTWI